MALGSLVRSTDSGLACPDWPMCYGQLVPYFDYQIFLEWFHRLLAGMLSISFVYFLWQVFTSPLLRKVFLKQFIVSFGLLAAQVVLGGLTVLKLLNAKVVSLHLVNAILFLSVLLWMLAKAQHMIKNVTSLDCSAEKKDVLSLRDSMKAKSVLGAFAILVFAQMTLGGMVSSNNAGLICPDFPLCMGKWIPDLSFLVSVQVFHRFLAYLLLIASVGLFFILRKQKLPLMVSLSIKLIPTLMALQILLGVANVVYRLPPLLSSLHLANALLIYVFAVWSYFYLRIEGS
jgi:cytochrome c oxidase assembly protein subunit 15